MAAQKSHRGTVAFAKIQSEIVVHLASLVTEDNYCRLVVEWARDQLLECICLAHSLVDQGGMFENVQPVI